MQSSPSLWYYADSAQQSVGPFSFADLKKLHAVGVVGDHTLVIESGQTDWRTLSSIADHQNGQTGDVHADQEPDSKTLEIASVVLAFVEKHRLELSQIPGTKAGANLDGKVLVAAIQALAGQPGLQKSESPLLLHWSGGTKGAGFLVTSQNLYGRNLTGGIWSVPLPEIHSAERRRVFGILPEVVVNGSLRTMTHALKTVHNRTLARAIRSLGRIARGEQGSLELTAEELENDTIQTGLERAQQSVAVSLVACLSLVPEWYHWALVVGMAGIVIAALVAFRLWNASSRVGLPKVLVAALGCLLAVGYALFELSPANQGHRDGASQAIAEMDNFADVEQAVAKAIKALPRKYSDDAEQASYTTSYAESFASSFQRKKREKVTQEAWKSGHQIGFMDAALGYKGGALRPSSELIEARARGAAGGIFKTKEQRDAFVHGYEAGYDGGWKNH